MPQVKKIGCIGFGHRAASIFQTIREYNESIADCEDAPYLKLSAVMDIRPNVADDLKKSGYSDVHIYQTPEEMYEKEALDGMVIATRCSLHTDYALLNAKYGVPVLLEKPVCTHEEDADRLCTILEKMDDKTVVSFPLRSAPLAVRAREVVTSGVLGTISQVQACNNVAYGRCYYHGWYRDDHETGGLFLQKATHDLDLISFLLGEPDVKDLCAMASKRIFKGDHPAGLHCPDCPERATCPESDRNVATYGDRYEVSDGCCFAVDTGNQDSGTVLVNYENGMHAVYTQNFVARKAAGKRMVRIIGYNATLELEFYHNTVDVLYHNEGKCVHYDMPALHHSGGDRAMIEDFARVVNGAPSKTPLRYGIRSAILCMAAQRSSDNHTYEKIKQI